MISYLFFEFLFLMCFTQINFLYANDTWTGRWFPDVPVKLSNSKQDKNKIKMGIKDSNCDNAKDNLEIDFNVAMINRFLCLQNLTLFKPNYNIEAVLNKYTIPPAYGALHKCMDTVISYEERLPTFGPHRPLWPKYGEYKYVPPQRWLHNLEHGAIVMLYHPCANKLQYEKLKKIVKNCLYRHIITPYNNLLPERPLALLSWGNSLEISVVDSKQVINFIKENALKGYEDLSENGQYDKFLISSAKYTSDKFDRLLCPNSLE